MLLAALVETDALLRVIGVSLAAVAGATIAFSLVIVGASGFADSRRDGRLAAAGVFGTLAVLAATACVAAVVFGIVIMISKD